MSYIEALGSVSNPDIAESYLAGQLTIDEVTEIAGIEDAEILRKYKFSL